MKNTNYDDYIDNMADVIDKIDENKDIYFEKANEKLKENTRMFAIRLSALIELKKQKTGKSQSAQGKELGVEKSVISEYSKGKKFPTLKFLLKASNYYDVSLDYLVGKSLVKKYDNEGLNQRFGMIDNTINVLEKALPKESINVIFDNELDSVNYLFEEIQNYKSDLKELDKFKTTDKYYGQEVSFAKVTHDINFAKFRMQQAFQNLIDEHFKDLIEEYNKKADDK